MKSIKVLGSGCAKCTKTAEAIEAVAKEKAVAVDVIKVTDPMAIMGYGVMSTPAVVVDEVVVHRGSIPHRTDIESWIV